MRTIGLEVKTDARDKAELEEKIMTLTSENEELRKQIEELKKLKKPVKESTKAE